MAMPLACPYQVPALASVSAGQISTHVMQFGVSLLQGNDDVATYNEKKLRQQRWKAEQKELQEERQRRRANKAEHMTQADDIAHACGDRTQLLMRLLPNHGINNSHAGEGPGWVGSTSYDASHKHDTARLPGAQQATVIFYSSKFTGRIGSCFILIHLLANSVCAMYGSMLFLSPLLLAGSYFCGSHKALPRVPGQLSPGSMRHCGAAAGFRMSVLCSAVLADAGNFMSLNLNSCEKRLVAGLEQSCSRTLSKADEAALRAHKEELDCLAAYLNSPIDRRAPVFLH